jgi:hypothetical protein
MGSNSYEGFLAMFDPTFLCGCNCKFLNMKTIDSQYGIWKAVFSNDIHTSSNIHSDFKEVFSRFPNPATNKIHIKGIQDWYEVVSVEIMNIY